LTPKSQEKENKKPPSNRAGRRHLKKKQKPERKSREEVPRRRAFLRGCQGTKKTKGIEMSQREGGAAKRKGKTSGENLFVLQQQSTENHGRRLNKSGGRGYRAIGRAGSTRNDPNECAQGGNEICEAKKTSTRLKRQGNKYQHRRGPEWPRNHFIRKTA